MHTQPKIGILYSRVRVEEKWIFGALEKRGVDYVRLDDRTIHFDLNHPAPWQEYDAVLERSISYNSGLYATRVLNAFGVPTVNSAAVAEICGDKLMTSAILARDDIPQPHNATAFTPDVLVVSLGVDTYEHDPISQFRLRTDDFTRIGARIAGVACPTLFVMEGGYAVEALGVNAVNVLTGFA